MTKRHGATKGVLLRSVFLWRRFAFWCGTEPSPVILTRSADVSVRGDLERRVGKPVLRCRSVVGLVFLVYGRATGSCAAVPRICPVWDRRPRRSLLQGAQTYPSAVVSRTGWTTCPPLPERSWSCFPGLRASRPAHVPLSRESVRCGTGALAGRKT